MDLDTVYEERDPEPQRVSGVLRSGNGPCLVTHKFSFQDKY